MKRFCKMALILMVSWAVARTGTGTARAEVIVTVYNGNPGGAGNGGGFLDYSGLTSLGSFAYYEPQFGIYNQAGGGNSNGDWRPFYKDNNYSTRITGQINVDATGSYTFSTRSDDGSIMKIDGNVVVNNNFFQGPTTRTGTVLLTQGVHNVEIQFYQGGGGKSLDVGSAPAGSDQNHPNVNKLPAGISWVEHSPPIAVKVYSDNGPGGPRYDFKTGALLNPNAELLGAFRAPDINFDYATGSRWSPFGRSTDYSVEMTGFLNAKNSQKYKFGLNSDDGSFLFIDGQLVINDGFFQGSNQNGLRGSPQVEGEDFLDEGIHTFEVRFYQGGGGAGVNLYLPDGVSYASPVPEPSSLILCGIAALGMAAYGWRRRRQAGVRMAPQVIEATPR